MLKSSNSELKQPTIPFGVVACAFSDNISQNSCISYNYVAYFFFLVFFVFNLLIMNIISLIFKSRMLNFVLIFVFSYLVQHVIYI